MGDVHQFLMEFGKKAALKTNVDRHVVEAAAGYLAAEGEIGFIYSGWAQAALPHRRLLDDQLGAVADVVEKRVGVISGLFNEPGPALSRRRRSRHGTG